MNLIGLLGFFLLLCSTTDSSLLDPVIENVRHIKATHPPDKVSGMWKKKMLWKPRWIKEWKSSNVLKPVWRKFWGPVIIREWVPIPKPPPQWDGVRGTLPEPNSKPPGVPFVDLGEPPVPNFSYLQKNPSSVSYTPPKQTQHGVSIPGAFSDGGQISYKAPHLPITSGFKSQAETYSGQSSYGSSVDNGAYDLNPPVEQFNPDYSYGPASGNQAQADHKHIPLLTVKPTAPHSHIHQQSSSYQHHHHHHHQQVKSNGHPHPSHNPDLTKFPPDWNSWEPTHPNPHSHSSGLAQAGSAVSIVSQVQSTTEKHHEVVGDHLFSQGLLPGDNDFIQQAALVSEYHYTENPLQNSISTAQVNPPLISSHVPRPDPSHDSNQTQSHSAVLDRPNVSVPFPPVQHLKSSPPPPITPHRPVPHVSHKTPPSPGHMAQTHAVHHKPMSKPSHNAKFPSPQVPPPTAASPKPNHPKVPPSHSLYSPNPTQTQPSPPSRTHTLPLHYTSPSSPPEHLNSPVNVHSQPHPNRQNLAHPRKPSLVPSQIAIGPPPRQPNSPPPKKAASSKPELLKSQKTYVNKPNELKVPDFKALPSTSVEAFHFIEGFPSNQTFTKAALIGNINHTGVEENQVEIIAAKPQQKQIPPYVAKLAHAIVSQHLKKGEENSSTAAEETTTEPHTEKTTVTIVYPSTNPFVRKTLKAYLEDESKEEKSTKVFVVTPVPHKVESSRDVTNGV